MMLLLTVMILTMNTTTQLLYELKMKSIDGEAIDFSQYRDKTLLIVNTASKCGYTPQYAELQDLHEKYGDQITILGFPANNFGGQEPGSNEEIAQFCEKNYGVAFQMFEKISVKGDDQSPLYQWLEEKTGKEPTWNFCKYLIKPDGTVLFFGSGVKPLGEEILSAAEL
ncbi:MAG: glutathione peroxidase [Saprospiraceae bacterium]|nr:glutathione peroxidase [Saprospiraceae bacterium]